MRIRIFLIMLFCFFDMFADDLIVLRNGDLIKARVTEITQTDVKYKKASNPTGPTYTISINEVLSINYENGDQDKFEQTSQGTAKSSELQNVKLEPVPADDNRLIIESYNKQSPILKSKKPSTKYDHDGLAYWGFSDESIVATDDIEIYFERCGDSKDLYESGEFENNCFILHIKNRSNEVVYIDLTGTYRSSHNERDGDHSSEWYDSTIYEKNNESSRGIAFGRTGIAWGRNWSNTASATKQMNEVLSIPPQSAISLPPHKHLVGDNIVSHYENFSTALSRTNRDKFGLTRYTLRTLSYEESPCKKEFYVTYSHNADFSSYYTIPIYMYVRAIYAWDPMFVKADKDYVVDDRSKMIISGVDFYKDK